jgi:glycerophosphoryl diester phosphodiesterase
MDIIGHRGARREAPENTLGGFRHLRGLGIDSVELDLHLASDGKLVVIHDYTTDRTTGSTGVVARMTSTELATLNAAATFKDWSGCEPIPSLEDVLSEWPALDAIQLEVKTAPVHSIPLLTATLADLIEDHQLVNRVTVTSHDVRVLARMKQCYPHIRRGLVAERFARSPLNTCRHLGCELLVMDHLGLTEAVIEIAHAMGMHVSTWTVNNENAALRLYRKGVDSLITDVPTRMLTHLRQRHRCG